MTRPMPYSRPVHALQVRPLNFLIITSMKNDETEFIKGSLAYVQTSTSKMFSHLQFDSKILGSKTARIGTQASDKIKSTLVELEEKNYELCYLTTCDKELDLQLELAPWFPGIAVGRKIVYICHSTKVTYQSAEGYGLFSVPREAPCEELVDLAFVCGHESRFKKDPSMTTSQFERMYRKWIKNSCLRVVADEMFAIFSLKDPSKTPVGFISLKRRENYASVELLAVSPNHQRCGLGSALLQRAKVWAMERQLDLKVVTQLDNEGARRAYEKAGFKEAQVYTDYHLWLPPVGKIKANRPYVSDREKLNLMKMFRSKAIESCGPFTIKCQEWIKNCIGSEHVCLSGSCTAALDQAAIVLGWEQGDEVIMPSYTFVSTANAFVLRGAVPVFVDIRKDTLNIDETKIEAAITKKTRAICVVHYAGMPCEMDSIMQIASRHNLVVVEDAAQAFLCKYKGRYLGSIGHFGCFSFHYTKNIIAGEGGALCINDRKYVDRALVVWEKGTNRFDFIHKKVDKYCWVDLGSSFVPNEHMSAFLMAQLEEAEEINSKRRRIFEVYAKELKCLETLGIRMTPMEPVTNGHIFWLIMQSKKQKEMVQMGFKEADIECFSHYVPLHSSPAGEKFGRSVGSMDVTNEAGELLIRLPGWNDMNWQHVYKVISALLKSLGQEHKVSKNCIRKYFLPR